ncbi:N-acyl-D-glucosamine 2-epimerase [Chitinophaga agrisoli]|uniref:Cellobiose 2-epimerase n=1 Tax=Chitinophaga agrisoli TaxID=2607653 RepID=A0A5B2VFU8_9BACT|nr:AGE family epimerase/isomerase [Chitinophaga agrisoli]KAA2238453.1 N-acyl-D-glucosamine 2-epimerase [Chitinophaga agrisoli]
MQTPLIRYREEVKQELYNILRYWQSHMVDKEQGGFYGAINNANEVQPNAAKGLVLNSRILWTFSAAYGFDQHKEWLPLAERAYDYLQQHFRDMQYGGLYWSVDAQGKPLDTRKQIYGEVFAIYALSEYYRRTQQQEALNWAIALYKLVERYSFDPLRKGYLDAFTREWQLTADTQLSNQKEHADKTMNTHLHILEAYTNLYRVWPDAGLRTQLYYLIKVFTDHIIHPQTHHQVLFFDAQWQHPSTVFSYGHDIEAAWLLPEAADLLHDSELTQQIRAVSMALTNAAAEGLDKTGGLRNEYEPATQHMDADKHWWVQAEAMVGFMNAYQQSGQEQYLQQSLHCWDFVKQYIIDKKEGEWYWGVTGDLQVMARQDKAGFWKCPYHNSRACLEIIHRVGEELKG